MELIKLHRPARLNERSAIEKNGMTKHEGRRKPECSNDENATASLPHQSDFVIDSTFNIRHFP